MWLDISMGDIHPLQSREHRNHLLQNKHNLLLGVRLPLLLLPSDLYIKGFVTQLHDDYVYQLWWEVWGFFIDLLNEVEAEAAD